MNPLFEQKEKNKVVTHTQIKVKKRERIQQQQQKMYSVYCSCLWQNVKYKKETQSKE